jgi:hypothetical protein
LGSTTSAQLLNVLLPHLAVNRLLPDDHTCVPQVNNATTSRRLSPLHRRLRFINSYGYIG